MGDDALGAITGNWYSAQLDNPINKRFVAAIQKDYKVDPGVYAAETYLCGEVLEEAVKQVKGNIEDKNNFMKALKGVNLKESLRGPMHFDEYGNVVGNNLYPQGRAQGRQAGQCGGEDLSGSQPVLDLQAGGVPEAAGLFARLPAGEESGAVILFASPPPEGEVDCRSAAGMGGGRH